jgi:chemotaxis protein histidine kinase CheA
MFAEEAEGRLAALSELLLELERSGGDPELLSSVFREAHTLKGAAAVVGLDDVLRVAHAMEEVLDGLRGGGAAATPAVVDALLGAVDGIREMVPAVLAGDDRATQADGLVAALHSPAAPASDPAPNPVPASPPGPATPEPRPPAPGPPEREGSPTAEPAAPAVHTPHPSPAANPAQDHPAVGGAAGRAGAAGR